MNIIYKYKYSSHIKFTFYRSGKPLKGLKQDHDMIWFTFGIVADGLGRKTTGSFINKIQIMRAWTEALI